MNILDALFKATLTRQAAWDAQGELEIALGFPDGNVPDAVDSYLYDAVADLAGGDMNGRVSVGTADAERIVAEVRAKTPEDWPE